MVAICDGLCCCARHRLCECECVIRTFVRRASTRVSSRSGQNGRAQGSKDRVLGVLAREHDAPLCDQEKQRAAGALLVRRRAALPLSSDQAGKGARKPGVDAKSAFLLSCCVLCLLWRARTRALTCTARTCCAALSRSKSRQEERVSLNEVERRRNEKERFRVFCFAFAHASSPTKRNQRISVL